MKNRPQKRSRQHEDRLWFTGVMTGSRRIKLHHTSSRFVNKIQSINKRRLLWLEAASVLYVQSYDVLMLSTPQPICELSYHDEECDKHLLFSQVCQEFIVVFISFLFLQFCTIFCLISVFCFVLFFFPRIVKNFYERKDIKEVRGQ